ncbi:MAG: hypothetical protein V4754_16070 [Pseudomonadota bacterium]
MQRAETVGAAEAAEAAELANPATPQPSRVSVAHLARLGLEAPSRLKRRVDQFCAAIDLTSALMRFNNTAFLDELRQPALPDADGNPYVSLADLHGQITAFQALLDRAPVGGKEDQAAVKQLKRLIGEVLKDIHNLQHGVQGKQRLAAALASLALYPLPFLTAYFQHEEQYLTLVCAAYAKTAALAIGYVRNDTSDFKLFLHHLKGRHSVFLYPAAAYAIPAFVKAANGLQKSIPYGLGAGLFTALALVATFYQREVGAMTQRVLGTLDNKGTLPDMVQSEVLGLIAAMQNNAAGVAELRAQFERQRGPISDHLSMQLSFLGEDGHALEHQLDQLLTAGQPDHAEGGAVRAATPANPDLGNKLAFAVSAAIVTFSVAALSYPELLGTVDLGIDAMFVSVLMLHLALTPTKTKQDALSEFKTFAGLSTAALAFTGINKATGFLDREGAFGPALAGITSANLLLSGPLASGLANALMALSHGAGSAWGYLRPAPAAEADLEMGRTGSVEEWPDDAAAPMAPPSPADATPRPRAIMPA